MEINVEQLTKVVQNNFILLTTEVEIKELLDELYEQSLLCIYDYESLLSKTRIERNYDFFMNIDMYGAAVAKKFMFWLDKRHEPLFFKLSNTQTHEKKEAIDDFESARKGQDCIRKQYVLLLKRLNANAIAPQLFQDGFLNRDHLKSVYILSTRKQRANQLLILLTARLRTNQIKVGVISSFTKALSVYQPDLCEEFMKHLDD